MKVLVMMLVLQALVLSPVFVQSTVISVNNVPVQLQTNATQSLQNLLGRMIFVINSVAVSILSIIWIWEGIFLFWHKDDREGLLKFKHDLPIMLLASVIILGATVIVNVLSYIANG